MLSQFPGFVVGVVSATVILTFVFTRTQTMTQWRRQRTRTRIITQSLNPDRYDASQTRKRAEVRRPTTLRTSASEPLFGAARVSAAKDYVGKAGAGLVATLADESKDEVVMPHRRSPELSDQDIASLRGVSVEDLE